jgi:hypothetical protein
MKLNAHENRIEKEELTEYWHVEYQLQEVLRNP